jgi:hypothetical protein
MAFSKEEAFEWTRFIPGCFWVRDGSDSAISVKKPHTLRMGLCC